MLFISSLRSGENQVTMHKCFLLLVFMVILLPSLGLSRYTYSRRTDPNQTISLAFIFIFLKFFNF